MGNRMNQGWLVALLLGAATPAWAQGQLDGTPPAEPPLVEEPPASAGPPETQADLPGTESLQEQALPLYQMRPDEIVGRKVVNIDDDQLGTLTQVAVRKSDQSLHAVISVGGLLGIFDRQIVVPLDELQPMDGNFLLSTTMTKDELRSRTPYEAMAYVPVRQNMPLSDVAEDVGTVGRIPQDFEALDENQDRQITPDEAGSRPELAQDFSQVDRNNNGLIDEGEFAQFSQEVRRPLRPQGPREGRGQPHAN